MLAGRFSLEYSMRVTILRRVPRASFSMDVYADSLIDGLKTVRPEWEIIVRSPVQGAASFGQSSLIAGGQKYYERYWQYPRSLKSLNADIFHIIDHSDGDLIYWLNRYQKPNVITCHDLINLVKPETYRGKAKFPLISLTAWKLAVRGMKNSDHVIAVSSHTKKDMVEHLNVAPHHITVVPNAVDGLFKPISNNKRQLLRHQRSVPQDTLCLLNVGSNNARKNVLTALKCVAALNSRDIPILFWKVGADFDAEQKDFIHIHRLESRVEYLGQPNGRELVKIYSAADVLLAPSLYEGFGLTALEAMACGTAVVTTNVSSIPEVVGNAAILTDPMDVDEIATAIESLYSDPQQRDEFIHKGLERVKQFTWEKTAEHVASIYEQVLEQKL